MMLFVAEVCITEFTDPGCPWAYSAEPVRRRLDWLYGERLQWRPRMVVLSESAEDYYGARQIVRCNTVLTVFGGVGGIMVV